jgi:hypothetical protein
LGIVNFVKEVKSSKQMGCVNFSIDIQSCGVSDNLVSCTGFKSVPDFPVGGPSGPLDFVFFGRGLESPPRNELISIERNL